MRLLEKNRLEELYSNYNVWGKYCPLQELYELVLDENVIHDYCTSDYCSYCYKGQNEYDTCMQYRELYNNVLK